VKFALEPPLLKPQATEDSDSLMVQQSIRITLTLEAIWSLRNKIAHHNEKVNILTFIKCLNLRADEHFAALFIPKESKKKKKKVLEYPPKDMIKLNVDATVSEDFMKKTV
jgi:hypothetical protein